MRLLQEYAQIRKEMGEKKFQEIEAYLRVHPERLLSDVYYKQTVYEEFEYENGIRKRLESLGKQLYGITSDGSVIWPIEAVNEFSDKELEVCKKMVIANSEQEKSIGRGR